MSGQGHILFLCGANSARSQMAEGLARYVAAGTVRVSSAGSAPGEINPLAIKVLAEIGIDISSHRAKHLDSIDASSVTQVVVLCAEESCPAFPAGVERSHWPLPDPKTLDDFRSVRDELRQRLEVLIS